MLVGLCFVIIQDHAIFNKEYLETAGENAVQKFLQFKYTLILVLGGKIYLHTRRNFCGLCLCYDVISNGFIMCKL